MRVLRYDQKNFPRAVRVLNRRAEPAAEVRESVAEILAAVREEGDAALLRFAAKFDGAKMSAREIAVPRGELIAAAAKAPREVRAAVRAAHVNVLDFAKRSLRKDWNAKNRQGVEVGERFDPFDRVGIYVPAGTAPLASTVLMTATLAAAAGVPEIVVTTPVGAGGTLHPAVACALEETGVTEVYKIGGAHAIGALAYGTRTIKPVSKIFGPGNPWVVEAKRQVFGLVAVDLLPGPSEILVIADGTANPAWIAADLLAQAEHGHGSGVVLLTTSKKVLEGVKAEITRQTKTLGRGAHLREVLKKNTWLVLVKDMQQAVQIANDYAPEHLSLVAKNDEALAKEIRTSGAIFLGGWSPVVGGDFLAGPSHELPTGGAGKSFPGLTVDQFQRRTSIVRFDERALRKSLPFIQAFSEVEGLDAHGRSAAIRLERP